MGVEFTIINYLCDDVLLYKDKVFVKYNKLSFQVIFAKV